MHDLVIENAMLIDGSGTPARPGAWRSRTAASSRSAMTWATGESVSTPTVSTLAPGIIDLHTHFDAQLLWDAFATPSVALGVTSVVIGNCGFTIAPCRAPDRDQTLRNLTHVEGMPLEALRAGVDWDFESYPEYLQLIERKGTVPNVASFVGPLVGAHLRAGQGRLQARGDAGGSGADEAPGDGGSARWGGGLLDLHAGAAQRRERHPHALASSRRARAAGADRRAGRSRQRRVHADQGHEDHGAVAGAALGAQPTSGDDRGDVRRSQRSAARVRRVRGDQRRA